MIFEIVIGESTRTYMKLLEAPDEQANRRGFVEDKLVIECLFMDKICSSCVAS